MCAVLLLGDYYKGYLQYSCFCCVNKTKSTLIFLHRVSVCAKQRDIDIPFLSARSSVCPMLVLYRTAVRILKLFSPFGRYIIPALQNSKEALNIRSIGQVCVFRPKNRIYLGNSTI